MRQIAIHGVPRSGTTWLGEIINSSPETIYRFQPLFSYALKGWLTDSSTTAEINGFFKQLVHVQDDFIDQQSQRASGHLPCFDKLDATHVAYKEVRYHHILPNLVNQSSDSFRLILVVRNPLAVLHSWLNAPKEFRSDLGWSEAEEWRFAPRKNLGRAEEFNGFEKWKQATRMFERLACEQPAKVLLIQYSDLLSDLEKSTKELFDFVDLPLSKQTLEFLDRSRSHQVDDAYSVFRTVSTDSKWRDGLNSEVSCAVANELRDTPLEKYLR